MKITHFASTADRYGDMCIVDLDKLKIMIDGGATKTDALLLYNNMIGDYKKLFVLSHWHSDHSAYLSYQNHNIKTILGRGCNGLVYPDDNDITIETGNDYVKVSQRIFEYGGNFITKLFCEKTIPKRRRKEQIFQLIHLPRGVIR